MSYKERHLRTKKDFYDYCYVSTMLSCVNLKFVNILNISGYENSLIIYKIAFLLKLSSQNLCALAINQEEAYIF